MNVRDIILLASGALISLLFIVGHDFILSRKAVQTTKYAVVDPLEIYQEKQKEALDIMMKKSSTDDERHKAADLAKTFPEDFNKAVLDLSIECECLVLNKSAVISPGLPDFTDRVRQKMKAK